MNLLKNNYFICLLVSLAFIFISCDQDKKTDQTDKPRSIQIIKEDGNKIAKIDEQTPEYKFKISYPILEDEYSQEICEAINSQIRSFIITEKAEFAKSANYVCSRDFEMNPYLSSFEGSYEIFSSTANYFSIRFTIYIDWSNAPNPSLYYKTINYDVQNKHLITINDFAHKYFETKDAAVRFFTDGCIKQIYNEIEIECQSFWKSERQISDFQFLNITDQGVYFIFDDYILDSHTCGNPQIFFSFEQIKQAT